MEHTKDCVRGNWVACPDCGQEYASTQGMHQVHQAKHGAEVAAQVQGGFICLSVVRVIKSRRPGWNTSPIVPTTLIARVLSIVGLWAVHPLIIHSPV